MPNSLIHEKSPYLLQHANNPVSWYPWGKTAFEKAKLEDKPIFLSIGYSTCHWCHVMEHESFMDIKVAEILNEHFIAIKVDREERPDIDSVYMNACQLLTGSGGWPLSVFLDVTGKPFFAGTYFPKNDSVGMIGFTTLLNRIHELWQNSRSDLLNVGKRITEYLSSQAKKEISVPNQDLITDGADILLSSFDTKYGGFSYAPKFPSPHNLLFLLRYAKTKGSTDALGAAVKTLEAIYAGGIHDHIGGGFCRYSTDEKWLVPHFEKMLYDNALLTLAFAECHALTKDDFYKEMAYETINYMIRDLRSQDGVFFTAEDADSEGEEGRFYLWTQNEIKNVLGDYEGEKFCHLYNMTGNGHFEGKSIPNLVNGFIPSGAKAFADSAKQKLFEERSKRVRPMRDEKILVSLNGLAIAALSTCGRYFNDPELTDFAALAADSILNRMTENERIFSKTEGGQLNGFCDDYAYFIWGLIELFEASLNPLYLEKALIFSDNMLKEFWDEETGGLFLYGRSSEQLISRPKEIYDGALPSSNSVACTNFLRLSRITGNTKYEHYGNEIISAFSSDVKANPAGAANYLSALLYYYTGGNEIIVTAGSKQQAESFITALNNEYLPYTAFIVYTNEHSRLQELCPYLSSYTPGIHPLAYICKNHSCETPVKDAAEFKSRLSSLYSS